MPRGEKEGGMPVENPRSRRAGAPITKPHNSPKPNRNGRPLTTGPIDPTENGRKNRAEGSDSETAPLPWLAPSDETTAALIQAGSPMALNAETPAEMERSQYARRRTLLKMLFVVAVALLIGVVWYGSPLTEPAANLSPRVLGAIPLAEVQPYGVNTFLHKEVDQWKREKTIKMAADMGAGWIKQQFPWAEIEYRQDPKNAYWDVKNNQSAWDKFDDIVGLAEKYGLRVIARIDSVPAWARTNDPQVIAKLKAQGLDPSKAPPTSDKMVDFGNFIAEFTRRYKGRVAAIQVWNEPNLKGEWATGQPVNSADYVTLLKTAYQAAKTVDPDMVILAAPLATNKERLDYAGNQNEFEYLQGMYDAGAKAYFDAMSANAYGTTYAPEDSPTTDKLNFRRVELLHDVMVKNGDEGKAVWFNEYGWNASPPSIPKEKQIWGSVTDQEQADYTVRGIEYAKAHWPWAGAFTIWYLRQVGDILPSASEYYFGLVNPDFVPSETYNSVQAAANGDSKLATPGDWGPMSAPIEAGPQWEMHLVDEGRQTANDASKSGGGVVITPTGTGDKIDITFLGTDLRITLVPVSTASEITDTIAPRYYVTVDGGTQHVAANLPRDGRGAYIDVPVNGVASEVTLVEGLGAQFATGRHTVEISVEGGDKSGELVGGGRVFSPLAQKVSLPGIGIVTVEAKRSYLLFGVVAGLLALSVVGLWWGLRRTRRV